MKLYLTLACTVSISILQAQNITTATNGLTKVGTNTVKLGGTTSLSENTSIDLGTSFYFNLKKSSTNYFTVLNGGNVGINTLSPNTKLEIDNTTTGTSGLRFTRLLSSSSAVAGNGKVLGVDASGNVIYVNTGTVTSVGLTMPAGFSVGSSPVTGSGTIAVTTTLNGILKGNGSGFTAVSTIGNADIADLAFSKLTSKPTTLAGYGIADAAASAHTHTLNSLSNVNVTGLTNGESLKWNSTTSNWERYVPSTGSVTSVGLTMPTGFTVSSSPVTTAGSIAISTTLNGILKGNGTGFTAVSTLANEDISDLAFSKLTGKPTTLSGYGITDAASLTHNHTLNSLSNVNVSGIANGDLLKWNSTTSNWEKFTPDYVSSANNYWTASGSDVSNTNSGNIGIGVANPSAKLEVNGSVKSNSGFAFGATYGAALDVDGTYSRFIANSNTDAILLYATKSVSSIRLHVNNGNRGLTLHGPSANLLFMGGSGETQSGIGNSNGTGHLTFLYSTVANSQTEGARLTNTGNFLIGTTTNDNQKLQVNGIIKSSGHRVDNGNGYYGDLSIVDVNGWSVNFMGGSAIARINNTGIGIGTIPAAQLHTTGSVRFAGLTTNNSLSNILVADGSGNLSLRDASTLGSGTANPNNWSLAGNTGINPSTSFLGTTDNQPLLFKTNNVQAMSIGTDAKVVMNKDLAVIGSGSGNLAAPAFSVTGDYIYARYLTAATITSQNFSVDAGQNVWLNTGKMLFRYGATLAGYQEPLVVKANYPTNTLVSLIIDNGVENAVPANYKITSFRASGTEKAYINKDGGAYFNSNVGIGTSSFSDPAYRLFVEGTIRARKIRVDNDNLPDYVFEDNYRLPSLAEVERYITLNKHLPDVPSANEVKKNGLDVGENQSILLKKIEELTLYMIQLNKKVEKLESENEKLKNKIKGNKR